VEEEVAKLEKILFNNAVGKIKKVIDLPEGEEEEQKAKLEESIKIRNIFLGGEISEVEKKA
jgi:hypothetical protein